MRSLLVLMVSILMLCGWVSVLSVDDLLERMVVVSMLVVMMLCVIMVI